MELKDFLLELISAKLKREKHMELAFEEVGGKRPDAVMKSSGSILGVILMAFDEPDTDILKRIEEFRGLDHPLYLLVKKGTHRAVTDMLFKRSIYDVKVVTWDIEVGL